MKVIIPSHSEEKSSVYKVCDNELFTSGKLEKHQSIHAGGKPFVCSLSDKSFQSPRRLKVHQRSHTGEKNPYVCFSCNISFTQSTSLHKHKQSKKHSERKSNFCIHCDDAPPQLINLQEHKMIHNGDKPFYCSQCNTNFSNKYYLHRH